MKKFFRFWPWLLVLLFVFVLFHNYFRVGVPYTHDGENHLARFANYKIALREGQFPPRWAPNLMNSYGYPVFNYNYPLANILSLPASIIGMSYELTFKLLMMGSVVFGLVGAGLWLRQILPNTSSWAQVLAVTSFACSIYLINLVNYRGNIGELMAYSLFPWMLWVIEQARNKKKFNFANISIWGILIMLFLISHNVTAVFAAPILVVYALVRVGINRRLLHWLVSLLVGVALGLWFWLPALAEKSFTIVSSANVAKEFGLHFATPGQLFFHPPQFGFSYPGVVDSLSFWIGPTLIVSLVLLPFVLYQHRDKLKNSNKPKLLLLVTLFVLSVLVIFFQTKHSQLIWQAVPMVRLVQFPWRIAIFLPTLTLPIVAYVFDFGGKLAKTAIVVATLTALCLALGSQPADFFHKSNVDYDAFGQSTSTENENLTPDIRFENIADWEDDVAIISGQGSIQVIEWRGSRRKYKLSADNDVTVVEPTMAFPGWQTRVSPQESSPYLADHINNDQVAGRLAYQIPAGNYLIESRFTQRTWARMTGNIISLLTLIGLTLAVGYELHKYAKK